MTKTLVQKIITFKFISCFLIYLLISAVTTYGRTEQELYYDTVFLHDWNETDHTHNGYDWSMPNCIESSENGAFARIALKMYLYISYTK